MIWKDDADHVHAPAIGDVRILSLVPSITELLFDLELANSVVGRTVYCIHPADKVVGVPTVGGTKKIAMDRVRELRPTHAIVNVDENPRSMAEELAREGISVVVTHPITVEDNDRLLRLIGGIFNASRRAEEWCERLARGLAKVGSTSWRERRVLYLIWKEPWMTVSRETYVSAMLALVGMRTMPVNSETRYPVIDPRDVLPVVDAVLLSSEPYPFTPEDTGRFREMHPSFTGRVMHVDGELLSWYGSRAVRGVEYVSALAAELAD
jgi:ABC-type Fe3+-hydroxamate transport system substrate-binding protein